MHEFTGALHEAPWWGPLLRELGDALPRLDRKDEARICLNLFLLTQPSAQERTHGEKQLAGLGARASARD